MDFTLYQESEIEQWINKYYVARKLLLPGDLDIDVIANIFGVEIVYYDGPCFSSNNSNVIFLTKSMQPNDQRDVFFHELCHILRHAGDQRNMQRLFLDLQEGQAETFGLYASLPLYMLMDITISSNQKQAAVQLSKLFKVSIATALARLQQIQRRITQNVVQEEYRKLIQRSYIAATASQQALVWSQPSYELALFYDYLENDMPSALVIKSASTHLDWSQPVYIPIPLDLERIEPDDFPDLITVNVPADYLMRKEDKSGCIGIHLPYLKSYVGKTEIDQLMIKISDLDSSVQRSFLQFSNF